MKYALLLLVGCANQQHPPFYSMRPASSPPAEISVPNTMQELVMDKQIQSMGRNEVIDAVKQCESAGLRAVPIYAKRKINGYSVETVVEVTCGPRYTY